MSPQRYENTTVWMHVRSLLLLTVCTMTSVYVAFQCVHDSHDKPPYLLWFACVCVFLCTSGAWTEEYRLHWKDNGSCNTLIITWLSPIMLQDEWPALLRQQLSLLCVPLSCHLSQSFFCIHIFCLLTLSCFLSLAQIIFIGMK